MACSRRFQCMAPALLLLCTSLRPEQRLSTESNSGLDAVSASLEEFQESAADAGLDQVDGLVNASRDALKMVNGEPSAEVQQALEHVIQVIKDTLMPTLDDLHKEDQALVETFHDEVTECNRGVTERLDGEIAENQKDAERLRGEEADLAQQVGDLQNQNKSKHEQIAALMSNKQPPPLCSSFPDMQVEELWEAYYKKVAEYSLTAAVEAQSLQDRRSERDSIVSSLVSTTEKLTFTSGALSAKFCDWKGNLLEACSTHSTCYTEASTRMKGQLKLFSDGRGKRIAAYRSALKLIDNINKIMYENPEAMDDDAEARFPPFGKEVPGKTKCDLEVLNEWDAALYNCKGEVVPCMSGAGTALPDHDDIFACESDIHGHHISTAPGCGEGWHVCTGSQVHQLEVTFSQARSFSGCYAYDSNNDCGSCAERCGSSSQYNNVLGSRPCGVSGGTDPDLSAMGSSCSGWAGTKDCPSGGRINSGNAGCTITKQSLSGVMCCKD